MTDIPKKRICLEKDNLEKLSKEELIERCIFLDSRVTELQGKVSKCDDSAGGTELGRLQTQLSDSLKQENYLFMRLASKELELSDILKQVEEQNRLKQSCGAELKSLQLDPAVTLAFYRMKAELKATQERLEQAQSELQAWRFTPDSQMGKRLMARCRQLLVENAELGESVSCGRVARLEGDCALTKGLLDEMRQTQQDMLDLVEEQDKESLALQSIICQFQAELSDSRAQIRQLKHNTRPTAKVSIRKGSHDESPDAKSNPDFNKNSDTPTKLDDPVQCSVNKLPKESSVEQVDLPTETIDPMSPACCVSEDLIRQQSKIVENESDLSGGGQALHNSSVSSNDYNVEVEKDRSNEPTLSHQQQTARVVEKDIPTVVDFPNQDDEKGNNSTVHSESAQSSVLETGLTFEECSIVNGNSLGKSFFDKSESRVSKRSVTKRTLRNKLYKKISPE